MTWPCFGCFSPSRLKKINLLITSNNCITTFVKFYHFFLSFFWFKVFYSRNWIAKRTRKKCLLSYHQVSSDISSSCLILHPAKAIDIFIYSFMLSICLSFWSKQSCVFLHILGKKNNRKTLLGLHAVRISQKRTNIPQSAFVSREHLILWNASTRESECDS